MPLKPVCVSCGLFYTPEKNGAIVEEGMPASFDEFNRFPNGWSSYKLWRGDKWKCRGCGNEIVIGFANLPFSEHYMGDYKDLRKKLIEAEMIDVFVGDC